MAGTAVGRGVIKNFLNKKFFPKKKKVQHLRLGVGSGGDPAWLFLIRH